MVTDDGVGKVDIQVWHGLALFLLCWSAVLSSRLSQLVRRFKRPKGQIVEIPGRQPWHWKGHLRSRGWNGLAPGVNWFTALLRVAQRRIVFARIRLWVSNCNQLV